MQYKKLQRAFFRFLPTILCFGILLSGLAFSGSAGAAEYSNTVGDSIAETQKSFPYLQVFIGSAALLLGVFLAGNGLIFIKKSQEGNGGNGQFTLNKGLFRIFGGAALAGLPDTLHYGIGSIMSGGHYTGGFDANPGTVQTCLSNANNASALSCVAQNIGVNVAPVAVKFLFAGAELVGLYIIIHTLYQIATSSEQSRTSMGQLWAKMAVGLIACNVPLAMYVFQNTLGISNGVITTTGSVIGGSNVPSVLAYNPDTSVAILKQFSNTISWCFVGLSVFGVFAFIKGLSILYGLANGRGQKGVTSALVHMIFGVLLANIKTAGCMLVSTTVNQAMGLCG